MEWERLLEPLSDESPTGGDLRYVDGDLTFQQVEENRHDEDPALVIEGDAKTANWPAVVRICDEALEEKTKDLELAAFLTEGLAHTEGFPGVRDGLRLVNRMLQTFWDQVHPGYEDGEIILPIRAKPLTWLGSPRCFLPAVKSIPIATGNYERFLGWGDYEMALRVDEASAQATDLHQELLDAGHVGTEAWNLALANTPHENLVECLEAVRECSAEVEDLAKVCYERFGDDDAPVLVELDTLLSDIRDYLQKRIAGEEVTDEEPLVDEGEAGEAAAGPVVAGGPIRTRRDALRQLDQVAQFFRQTEPHSPISYLVQRAVRWGNMPLEDLLKEVVKSDEALSHIWETLGIRPPSEQEE